MRTRAAVLALAIWFGGGALLSYVWEMAQMSLYDVGNRGVACLRATAGDVALLGVVYLTMALAAGSRDWFHDALAGRALAACLMGAWISIAMEQASLAVGRWTYSASMPRLPFFRVGLSPVLQFVVIPLVLAVAIRVSDRALASERGHRQIP